VVFVVLLAGGFTLLSWNPVNDHLIEPFTRAIAAASGVVLNLLGQHVARNDTVLQSARFAVNIRNGCNGVEALIIYVAAVVAFPASWRSRGLGLLLGAVAIQAINLVRVAALFLTGAYLPRFFDSAHTVVWQTIVILAAVLLFIYWALRLAERQPADR